MKLRHMAGAIFFCGLFLLSGCELFERLFKVSNVKISSPSNNALTDSGSVGVWGYTINANVQYLTCTVNGDFCGTNFNPDYDANWDPATSEEIDSRCDFNYDFGSVILDSGSNTIRVYGYDDVSDRTLEATVSVVYDTIAPSLIINTPSYNQTLYSRSVTFSGTASDNDRISTLLYQGQYGQFDNIELSGSSWSVTLNDLPFANNQYVTFTAWDRIGHKTEQTVYFNCVDNAPPGIAITDPSPDAIVIGNTVVISGTVSDNDLVDHMSYTREDTGTGAISVTGTTWTVTISDLPFVYQHVTVTAVDRKGNSSNSVIHFTCTN